MSTFLLADARNARAPAANPWLAPALVAATVVFNFGLCFLHTHVLHVGAPVVAAAQLLIMMGALLWALQEFSARFMIPAILLTGYMVSLVLVNPAAPPKILIDVAIPAIFYALGRQSADTDRADRLMLWLSGGVLAFGLFEIALPDLHARTLNIISYYIDKGGAEEAQASVTGTSLFVSGMRPDGRTFLAFLGDHRVSSIFLEPVSMGNFTVICCAWAFLRWRARPRLALAIAAISTLNAMLADARFAIMSTAAMALVGASPLPRSRAWVLSLPVLALGLLVAYGATGHEEQIDNGFTGRLIGAGLLLLDLSPMQWMALVHPPAFTADAGYVYLITSLGLLPCLIIWGMYAAAHRRSGPAARLSAMLAVYLCLSLLVSNSAVSIKTAALAWFLLGVTWAVQEGKARATPTRGKEVSA
ncbi:hypothetical protein ACFQX4_21990 [Roseomonas sp. GCM10028921]